MTNKSIESHDLFFSRIISMISTDLYKHSNDSAASEEENSKYYKHKKVALGADEKKIASSKKRMLKYGASKDEEEEEEEGEEGEGEDEEDAYPSSAVMTTNNTEDERGTDNDNDSNTSSSTNLDDLRLRLQRRILGLKTMRSSTKEREPANADKVAAARKKAKNDHTKRKPSMQDNDKMDVEDGDGGDGGEGEGDDVSMSGHSLTSLPIEDFGDVQFSLMAAKRSVKDKDSSASKPGTKMKRLKRMLETADKKRQRLDELKSAGSAGANRLKQEQWTDVLKSATGRLMGI